ncbi:MAG TPA: GNAT family N-acetyltransferase [Thermoanaerobaculia bacterium]|nr:GNAT family N-acetyltransferase [Thermoanaerobaculia bacterium]
MIRPAQPNDAAALAQLAGELGYPSNAREMSAQLAILSASASDAVLVAESDGRVDGWIHVCATMSLESGAQGEIRGLVVTEERRGHGVGAELVQAAEEWARERGLPRIRVRTNVNRERAHRFYERCGFTHEKTSRVYEKDFGF